MRVCVWKQLKRRYRPKSGGFFWLKKLMLMKKKIVFEKDKTLTCDIVSFSNTSCVLDSGYKLKNFKIAYKSFGKLNKDKTNAIYLLNELERFCNI